VAWFDESEYEDEIGILKKFEREEYNMLTLMYGGIPKENK
jgi:hypothetical protein